MTTTNRKPAVCSMFAWIFVVCSFGCGTTEADTLLPGGTPETALAEAGLEAMWGGRPVAAESLLTRYLTTFPDDPVAWLLRLKLWWWSILEGRAELQATLESDFQRLQEVAQSRLARDPDDLRALVALGEAHCAMGRLQGIRGQGWAALQSHRQGVPLLERALALDPDLAEPRVSLGVYHYYAARAPGFLRFLGRLLSVQADRRRGLQELWLAATTPGMQQAEATFFLVEVLCGVEDDALEALPLAMRLHARFPGSLPAALSLASVHLALERPDLAVAVLTPLAGEYRPRPVAARFFVARTLCVSGRVQEGLEILDGFTRDELETVTWLRGWHAYYRGLAYEQLGRLREARRAFEVACDAPEVADSHRYARRALDQSGNPLQRSVRAAEAALSWDVDRRHAQRELTSLLNKEKEGSEEGRRRARLALAVMASQQGAWDAAVDLLLPLMRETGGDDEAWLVVRPRVRLLQALCNSGRMEEARTWAARFGASLGEWGSNRHLELLVQTCAQSEPACAESGTGGMTQSGSVLTRFGLKDTGFTAVRLQRVVGAEVISIPMSLHDGFWEVEIKLGQGTHLYRFDLECLQTFPDPEASEFTERDDGIWSVCSIGAVENSPITADGSD